MKMNSIALVITSAIVGILMVSAVLVPIINSGVNPSTTIDNGNTAFSQLNEINVGDSIIFEKEDSAINNWNVNGVTISTNNISTLVITDTFSFIVNNSWSMDENYGSLIVNFVTTPIPSGYEFKIEMNNGQATITYGADSTTTTVEYTWGYVLAPLGKGEFTNAYVNANVINYDDVIIGNNGFWGRNGDIKTSGGLDATIGGGETISGYESLIRFSESNKLALTNPQTDVTTTYSSFIVPTKVVAYEESDLGVLEVILTIIPIFAIIGLLIAIVRGAIART